jgi:poly-gamma-glutamate system protein
VRKLSSAARTMTAIIVAAVLSLAYLVLVNLPSLAGGRELRREELQAATLMARAEAAIRDCREARGIPIDHSVDPNGTGLIGVERSEITTSAGRLEAKRTTTNPAFAALVVSLLREAGARRGDAVAVGASGSFPALIVATLAAAEVTGVEPLVISSLGASEWGANIARFTWLDMEECLRRRGLITVRPIARALGGDEDTGRDLSPEGRALLAERIRAAGAPVIEEPDLTSDVARRVALYRESAGDSPIKAFVNIGGGWANMGTDPDILKVRPGLARRVIIPPAGRRGVIQAMAAAGVPVIHLLNVRGLCERYGLPWDPRPLPAPGQGAFYRRAVPGSPTALPVTLVYVVLVLAALAAGRSRFPGA